MKSLEPASPQRRSYKRFKLDTSATIAINGNQQKSLLLRDLSSRGAGVMSDYAFALDEEIRLTIEIPYLFTKTIIRQARTVWCNKVADNLWRAGLDFGLDNQIELG